MSTADSPDQILPDPYTPRCLGVLNISFSLCLMTVGLCANAMSLMVPILSYAVTKQADQAAQREGERQAEIATLKKAEQTETDPAKKADLLEQIADLEAPPDSDLEQLKFIGNPSFRDPRLVMHFVADLASGMILNLFFLIAGIGLYLMKSWGRWLSVIVAWAKLIRLFALAVSATVILAPLVSSLVTEFEIATPVDGVPFVGQKVGMMVAALYWLMFVIGSIYPVVLIVLLRRPSLRLALGRGRERYSS